DVLGGNQAAALLFKQLATLKTDAPLFPSVDELEWNGPTASFAATAEKLGDPGLVERLAAVGNTA
ncbi:MAG TPA: hypothetical protein VFC35_06115, partial [Gemmatimonadaceae bacterium]|nr:hypothetical protein [Gemmatimonadaceae bacterium]